MASKTPKKAGLAVSAIVPAWGDEPTLRRAVAALRNDLAARCEKFEIVLVDDGAVAPSPSAVNMSGSASAPPRAAVPHSGALADAIAAAHAEARTIHLGAHHGRGAVLRSGSASARMPLVLYFDPTGGFVADDVRHFLDAVRDADIVVGYRAKPPTARGDRLHWWVHRRVLALLFGVFVREAECGFKLMRREILERIHLASDGDFADAELLAKANVLGARIAEVPVSLSPSSAVARGVRPCCGRQARREAWRLFHHPDLCGPM
jgi:glycosyltransferase involved in cell wall biosynthesis